MAMTPYQLDESANAPCTRTIVGFTGCAVATPASRRPVSAKIVAKIFIANSFFRTLSLLSIAKRLDAARSSDANSLRLSCRVFLGCVLGEDKVVIFGRRVAGKAGLVHGFAIGLAVGELRKSPASGRGIFLRILDHELNVARRAGDGGRGEKLSDLLLRHALLLGSGAEGLVVFLRCHLVIGEAGDDGAIGERTRTVPIGLDRDVIAELDAQIVERCAYLRKRNHAPVAIPVGKFDAVDRGDVTLSLTKCRNIRRQNAHRDGSDSGQ